MNLKTRTGSPSLVRQETALLRELAGLRREISAKSAAERLARAGRDRRQQLPAAGSPAKSAIGGEALRHRPLVEDAAD